jgi:hypothetical protein
MAENTPVIVPDRPGRTLKSTLYKNGSAVESDIAGSESGNAPGDYTFTVTGALTGIHQLILTSAGQAVGKFEVKLYDITGRLMAVEPGTAEAREAACYPERRIYIDTDNGVAGTVICENGTITNPVDSWADAQTIATAMNLARFHLAKGASLTFSAATTGKRFSGYNYTILPSGNSIATSEFVGARFSGTVGDTLNARFLNCEINSFALSGTGGYQAIGCRYAGEQDLDDGVYALTDCVANQNFLTPPIFDFGTSNIIVLNVVRWGGSLRLKRGNSSCSATITGRGTIIIDSDCVLDSINVRGDFVIVDNVDGGFAGTLTYDRQPVNMMQIYDSETAAENQQRLNDSMLPVVVDDEDFPPTTSAFETTNTDIADDDTLVGSAGTFYSASGTPNNVGTYFITASQGTTNNTNDKLKLTVEGLTAAPADGEIFLIQGARSRPT